MNKAIYIAWYDVSGDFIHPYVALWVNKSVEGDLAKAEKHVATQYPGQSLVMELEPSDKAKQTVKAAIIKQAKAKYPNLKIAESMNKAKELLELAKTDEGTLKQVGRWVYSSDGSAGEFYGKTSMSTMKAFLAKNSDKAAPFETAIPDGEEISFYHANSNHPYDTMSLQDYNSENGTEYEDWDDFFKDDQG
jgi:hypothetical protein